MTATTWVWSILLVSGSAIAAPPAPDGDDYVEDFESYTPHVSLATAGQYVSLGGQFSPAGFQWSPVNIPDLPPIHPKFRGVVDNALAQTGPHWGTAGFLDEDSVWSTHGAPGGPDPTGAHGQFYVNPRGTIDPQEFNEGVNFLNVNSHPLYAVTPLEPLVVSADFYFDNVFTLAWWRTISSREGLLFSSILLGGFDTELCSFACFGGPFPHDFAAILGAHPTEPGNGAYYRADQFRFGSKEWMTIAIRKTVQGESVWLRNAETTGANSSGMPFDAPGFAGEIFDTGWVQLFPGFEDDPLTPVIEGTGLAVAGIGGPTAPRIVDETGNEVAPRHLVGSIDRLELIGDADPNPLSEPLFEPHDWYVDNYMALGAPGCAFDPAFSVPQVIDGEDLAQLLADWGTNAARSDSDGDGNVGGNDLAALLAAWGPCAQ